MIKAMGTQELVNSRTKAKGRLFYVKDIGTLERNNVTGVLMEYHDMTTYIKQLIKTV